MLPTDPISNSPPRSSPFLSGSPSPAPANNLAFLSEAVHRAVALQLKDPHRPQDVAESAKEQAITRIAGITVIDPDRLDAHKETRRQALQAYRQDAHELRRLLDHGGVSYLTIWPAKAWETLRREAGLFRFSPDQNGRVAIDHVVLDRLLGSIIAQVDPALDRRFWKTILSAAVTGYALVTFLFMLMGLSFWPASILGFIGAFLSFGGAAGILRLIDEDRTKLELRLITKTLRKNSSDTARLLWPDRTEPPPSSPVDHDENLDWISLSWPDHPRPLPEWRIAIELPPAPAAVRTNLLKAQKTGLPLHVHVVGEAITFREDPAEILIRKRNLREQSRRAEEEQRRPAIKDPIVTATYRGATAIIAQYGEFPIEKQLISRILNSSALI